MDDHSRSLAERFGNSWNRFWFTPTSGWTLSTIRVLAGLVAVYVHATFSWDLERLFGPGGLLPQRAVDPLQSNWAGVSYLGLVSSPTELWIVHGLGLAVLLLFTAGLFTRVTSVLALVVALSYIHRATMITSLAEPIMALVLFYLCLGPCGKHLSLDAALVRRRAAGGRPPSERTSSLSWGANVATRLLQVHISAVYIAMAVGKLTAASAFQDQIAKSWWTGDAVWDLIAKPESRLVDLTWLASYPLLIAAWTHAIVLFELSFGVLIWLRGSARLLLPLAVIMWASLALITGHAVFCAWMLVGSLAFVPDQASERFWARLAGRPRASSA